MLHTLQYVELPTYCRTQVYLNICYATSYIFPGMQVRRYSRYAQYRLNISYATSYIVSCIITAGTITQYRLNICYATSYIVPCTITASTITQYRINLCYVTSYVTMFCFMFVWADTGYAAFFP